MGKEAESCWASEMPHVCGDGIPCPWVCQKCKLRVVGALGFGPPCGCGTKESRQAATMAAMLETPGMGLPVAAAYVRELVNAKLAQGPCCNDMVLGYCGCPEPRNV